MTAALEGGEWSATRPGRTSPPGKTRYLFYRRLGGPQDRLGRSENLVPIGIRSKKVVSTDNYTLRTLLHQELKKKTHLKRFNCFCLIYLTQHNRGLTQSFSLNFTSVTPAMTPVQCPFPSNRYQPSTYHMTDCLPLS